MVAVRLAIGGDVHELGVLTAIIKAFRQAKKEALAVIQQPLERDPMRHDRIEKEDSDRTP